MKKTTASSTDMENAKVDESSSCTTSSSGIPNCDITILGHESISNLTGDLETELQNRKYTVAIPLAAGRTKVDNLISKVGHAKIKVIILNKVTATEWQNHLAPILQPSISNIATMILLYEDGLKESNIQESFRTLIQIKLKTTVADIIEQITWFIKLQNYSEQKKITDAKDKKYLFADFLLHSAINPDRTKQICCLDVSLLVEQFELQHGSFLIKNISEHLRTRVGGFQVKKQKVTQTKLGANFAHTFSSIAPDFLSHHNCNCTNDDKNREDHNLSTVTENNEASVADTIAKRTNRWVKTTEDADTDTESASSIALNRLKAHFKNFDSSVAYFLLTSQLPLNRYLKSILNIPWLKVFDFHEKSRNEGLQSFVNDGLSCKTNLTLTSLKDPVRNVSVRATDWVFVGRSKTENAIAWLSRNNDSFQQHCAVLADFCSYQKPPSFLILWYKDDETEIDCLEGFLHILFMKFPSAESENIFENIILCIPASLENNKVLHQVKRKYCLLDKTVTISLSTLCSWLDKVNIPYFQPAGSMTLLRRNATNEQTSVANIAAEKVAWIKDYIELLPLESQDRISKRRKSDAGKAFVKGEMITWDDIGQGKIAVKRDIQEEVYNNIKQDILEKKMTFVITIYHAPGGGGTTFARQLLWYLHSDFPCGVVLQTPTLSINAVKERVEVLHNATQLPVILLVQGRSDYEVKQLYESCKYVVVILHLQRYHLDIKRNRCELAAKKKFDPTSRKCYLSGKVAPDEAKNLAEIFSSFAPKSRDKLLAMTGDVLQNKTRYIFEYGLAAFDGEYKGVRKYVEGYMQLQDRGLTINDLLNWQKVVTFLSLTLYYGQAGMPKWIFRKIFGEVSKGKSMQPVTLENLPYNGRQFITELQGEWKINYNVVAKEILEQVLCFDKPPFDHSKMSEQARTRIHKIVIEFIHYLKGVLVESAPERIVKLLCDMMLKRDYKEVDMHDSYGRKNRLSKLLEDVSDESMRVTILTELTIAFPRQAEFHAHLGRLLSMMDEFERAEMSLQKALDIRMKYLANADATWVDTVRGRIHHMFGFVYLRKAQHKLKCKSLGKFDPKQVETHEEEDTKIKVFSFIKKAVSHFSKSREHTTQNLSYGYISEVVARLQMAEYVHKTFEGGCIEAFTDNLGSENRELSEFIRESHSECDQLLTECQHYVPLSELVKIDDYYSCVTSFNIFFEALKNLSLPQSTSPTNILQKRSEIAGIKMSHYFKQHKRGKKGEIPSLDHIKNETDILEVVNLYEGIFRDQNRFTALSISVDVLEWLEAIRHPFVKKEYDLMLVLQIVENWESKCQSIDASFYLYIIYFLLTMWIPGEKMTLEYKAKCKKVFEKLQSKKYWFPQLHLTKEWLAHHDELSIRRLMSRKKLGTWDKDTRFWKDQKAVSKLQVCTGTIVKSSQTLRGIISIDVPNSSPNHRVEVHFVPRIYNLYGKRFSEQQTRVEFFVGFSVEHGAEALAIKELKIKKCKACLCNTEIITLNAVREPTCIKCDEPL